MPALLRFLLIPLVLCAAIQPSLDRDVRDDATQEECAAAAASASRIGGGGTSMPKGFGGNAAQVGVHAGPVPPATASASPGLADLPGLPALILRRHLAPVVLLR